MFHNNYLSIIRAKISRNGKRTQGFFVPDNGWSKRAYVAGTASAGGNLIATDLLDGNFIEALRNRTVVGELGATYLPGLVGNVAIPKRATDNTAYWFAGDNSDSITESTGTISAPLALIASQLGFWRKVSLNPMNTFKFNEKCFAAIENIFPL